MELRNQNDPIMLAVNGAGRLSARTESVPLFGSQNATYAMRSVVHYTGKRSYELNNHLGNVLSVISDKVIPHQNGSSVDYWLADIRQSSDYSPFGVLLKNRDLPLTSGSGNVPYRYGYQGSERDDEMKGSGNSYTTEFRQLDTRLGRWLSIDPKAGSMPWQSPYCSMDNNPIWFNDILGDKVGYEKGAFATDDDLKGFKKEIRQMRRNSKSFREMYKELDASDEMYIFTPSRKKGDASFGGLFEDKTKTKDGQNHIYVNLNLNSSEKYGTIAHETGHAWRYLHKLDIKPIEVPEPTPPSRVFNPLDKKATDKYESDRSAYEKKRDKIKDDNFVKTADFKKNFELAALHIENIVISELKHNRRFKDLQFSGFYMGLPHYEMNNGRPIPTIIHAPNLYPESYYDKKLDLYKENNLVRP